VQEAGQALMTKVLLRWADLGIIWLNHKREVQVMAPSPFIRLPWYSSVTIHKHNNKPMRDRSKEMSELAPCFVRHEDIQAIPLLKYNKKKTKHYIRTQKDAVRIAQRVAACQTAANIQPESRQNVVAVNIDFKIPLEHKGKIQPELGPPRSDGSGSPIITPPQVSNHPTMVEVRRAAARAALLRVCWRTHVLAKSGRVQQACTLGRIQSAAPS
jgi:hypothetical protein